MKKLGHIKRLLLLFILTLGLWLFPNNVLAATDEIHSIDMEVTLQEDGSAKIQSVWKLSQYHGTEFYLPMGNTETSKVTQFSVSENRQKFEDLGENWDTDKSLEEKKFKSGIYLNEGQQELCWGIGSFGEHEYHLEYIISNFVRKTSDNKYLIFWKFLNDSMNLPVNRMNVTIKASAPMNKEALRIWGFGFYGNTEIKEDGTLYAESTGEIDYFTLLAFVPGENFNQVISIEDSSDDIVAEAKEGSDYGSFNGEEDRSIFYTILSVVVGISIPLISFLYLRTNPKYKSKLKQKNLEGQYWRDIPFKGDYHLMAVPIEGLKLGNEDSIMTAYFLKWILNGSLRLIEDQSSRSKKKQKLAVHADKFEQTMDSTSEIEVRLFQMVQKASVDGILEAKEFTHWAKNHYKKLENWQEDAYIDSEKYLVNHIYYEYEGSRSLFLKSHVKPTKKGTELEENIVKFRNYLLEFSLLNERRAVDVHLWDELLIWASLLGVADEVYEEFNKLYPKFASETQITPEAIYWSNYYSHHAIIAASNAASSAKSSSGFGGSTSFGGGGGSFGGGSGGGYR